MRCHEKDAKPLEYEDDKKSLHVWIFKDRLLISYKFQVADQINKPETLPQLGIELGSLPKATVAVAECTLFGLLPVYHSEFRVIPENSWHQKPPNAFDSQLQYSLLSSETD